MVTFQDVLEAARKLSQEEKAQLLDIIQRELKHERHTSAPQTFYGALADLGEAPSAEDIDEARKEMWGNFPREDIL